MYLPLESVTVVGAITSAAVLLNCAQAMAAVRRKRARSRIRGLRGLQAPLPTQGGTPVAALIGAPTGCPLGREGSRPGQLTALHGPLRLVLLTPATDGQRVRTDLD